MLALARTVSAVVPISGWRKKETFFSPQIWTGRSDLCRITATRTQTRVKKLAFLCPSLLIFIEIIGKTKQKHGHVAPTKCRHNTRKTISAHVTTMCPSYLLRSMRNTIKSWGLICSQGKHTPNKRHLVKRVSQLMYKIQPRRKRPKRCFIEKSCV